MNAGRATARPAGVLQRRLAGLARGARLPMLLCAGASAGSALTSVAQMVVAARLIASALDASLPRMWYASIPLLFAMVVARAALAALGEWSAQRVATSIKSKLRLDLVRSMIHAPRLSPAAHTSTGGAVMTMMEGVESLDLYYRRFLPQALATAIVPLIVLAAVAWFDPLSALILALTGPLIPLFMWLLGTLAERRAREQWRALSLLGARFLDTLQGLPTLTAFNRADGAATAVGRASESLRVRTMAVLRVAFLSGFVLELAASVSTALVAAGIGVRLIEGHLPLIAGLTVLLLTPEFYLPFRQLGQRHHAGMEGLAAADRIFDLLDAAPVTRAAPMPGGRTIHADAALLLTGITVRYPDTERPALDDVSLTFAPCTFTAIVGASGAGKSTLLNVLLGFVPATGRVSFGDQRLEFDDTATWRTLIAYSPQRPRFVHGTVADNLRLGHQAASTEAMSKAAALAHADAFIQRLPHGYDTVIDESASILSGGERQRLALARALLKPAPLLLLDEPTSSLDERTESLVAAALRQASQHRTVVAVVHRLATALQADRVIVLEAGRIVECGTPPALLRSGGAFARLVSADGREAA